MTSSPWLTVQGAAEYAACHPNTVYNALAAGELVGHKKRGKGKRGHWRISEAAIDSWLSGDIAPGQKRRLRSA